jgi:iron complex transport system ATP-binding protein
MEIQKAHIGYTNSLFVVENLTVDSGEILCILGNNGCGKSTLLQTMAGFLPPFKGSMASDANRQIAFLGSKSQSHPQLKVGQALLLAYNRHKPWYKGYSEEQILACDNLLKEYNLFHKKGAYVNELSDGQMQKLWLGQALLSNPDMLFLDEPTGHLDATNTAFIFMKLKQWVAQENKSVVLTSHKIDWILQFSDNILLIDNNKSEQYCVNDPNLIPKLNGCFSGDNHLVDFGKVQYKLQFDNIN